MKKLPLPLIAIAILLVSSCKKNNFSAGSWRFEGTTYTATSASLSTTVNSTYALTATTSSTTSSGALVIYFPYRPAASGTYRVINYTTPLDSNQLYIEFTGSATNFSYYSTGNDNVNAQVTVSSSGKVSVAIPPVYLMDYANPVPDSAQLTATINQQ